MQAKEISHLHVFNMFSVINKKILENQEKLTTTHSVWFSPDTQHPALLIKTEAFDLTSSLLD